MGVSMMMLDVFVPLPLPLAIMFTTKIMGLGFFAIGMMILGGRIMVTGVGPFIEIPNTQRVILMHQRRGKNPNTKFLTAQLDDLEYIRSKNKIFKDTGGGFRIAGHDVRRTHEMISFDIPEWLSQYFYQVKDRYGTHNSEEWKELRNELKNLKQPLEGVMTMEQQLNRIKLLKPIMDNPVKKKVILDMELEDLQNMTELTYADGITHHGEEVEEFIESATPNELSVLEKQKYLNDKMEEKHYKEPGEVNWGKFVPYILMLMLGGAIAVAIIAGVFQ